MGTKIHEGSRNETIRHSGSVGGRGNQQQRQREHRLCNTEIYACSPDNMPSIFNTLWRKKDTALWGTAK
ncbi:hypothetical protein TUMSATVNIG3_57210 (plasmid) [Vibrio nigripulchritudo]|nr:hypothetical protein TUMSATVNIG2_56270 [Vibrio nigripulchritudo]BDU46923.1 hypothetical protein TUMSATVNIG3_57210 [Vibrio nigripulchritudo]